MATATNPALMEAMAARFLGDDKTTIVLPFFMGCYIDSLLVGLSIVQLFRYRRFMRKDKPHIAGLVIIAFVATFASSLLGVLWMISLYVTGFGAYLPFARTTWLCRHMVSEIICTLVVQVSYIDRACRLWKSYWPAIVLGPTSLATAILGCFVLRHFSDMETFTSGAQDYTTNALTYSLVSSLIMPPRKLMPQFSALIATDALITLVLAGGLFRQKTGWKHTDSLVMRLIYRCCETQFFALVSTVVIIIAWNQAYGVAVCIMLFQTKIYYLGLQVALNSRIGTSKHSLNVSYPSVPLNEVKESSCPHSATQRGCATLDSPQIDEHTTPTTSSQDLVQHAEVYSEYAASGERDGSASRASLQQ